MPVNIKTGFPIFVSVWNKAQGLNTPDLHFDMASWLERRWLNRDTQLLLMAFRGGGKSTIAGLFCCWLIYRNPNIRILVLAADFILARKMVGNVKRILERHPLTTRLKPERPDQWAGDRFTVQREGELRDPSMLAKGVTSNITGSRADVVICDDVEVPNTCDTAEKRDALRARLGEIDYILVPGGTQFYIGTPHSYHSIYRVAGEAENFLAGFHRMELPILKPDGTSRWPERFSDVDIETIKRRTGPNKFASQMMLTPVNIAEGRLEPDLIGFYNENLSYSEAGRRPVLHLGGTRLVSASAWWDPAFGKQNGDNSVFAAVFSDAQGGRYLHHICYIRPNCQSDEDTGDDEATRQCRIVAQMARELYLPAIAVEINGIGRFLPGILRRELARTGYRCAVIEISSRRPKHIRILEAFDIVLAARALQAHDSVRHTPFLEEMRDWRPEGGKGHDDGLDAVAGALLLEPLRLKPVTYNGDQKPGWTNGGVLHKAESDFNP